MLRLPVPCLVVLAGPPASGKSTWAAEQFRPDQIVSSDALRALVGEGEHDQRASKDAFALLDTVVSTRLRRGLVTVIDTLGNDAGRRARWAAIAAEHTIPAVVVAFDTEPAECRRRNAARSRPVPAAFLAQQLKAWPGVRAALDDESWTAVAPPSVVSLVPASHHTAPAFAARQREDPVTVAFDLHIAAFGNAGGPAALREHLAEVAVAAEQAGFAGLWVMDHFLQIPQVGREWDDMLESYTTLGYLAGVTTRARLGVLVTGVTYRNPAHLGKLVATLDVLSGGRAVCGLGAAWYEREHNVYGWAFPHRRDRLDRLEDTLRLLPLMWGPGSPRFEGRTLDVPEAICYPRPLQSRVPIVVGGSGERRTLRLVAELADACNLFGDAANVRRKLSVLHRHCDAVGRDPAEIEVTHLSDVLVAESPDSLERWRPPAMTPERYAAHVNAAPAEDHVGRFRELAEAGVQRAIVSLVDLADGRAAVDRFAPVIAAFT